MGCIHSKETVTLTDSSSQRYLEQELETSLSDTRGRAESLVAHARSQAACDTNMTGSRRTTTTTHCSRNSSSSFTSTPCTAWRTKVLSSATGGCHYVVRQVVEQWPPGHPVRPVLDEVVGQCRREEDLVALIRESTRLPLPVEDFPQHDAPHAIRARCNFLKALRERHQEALFPCCLDAPASASSFVLSSSAPATSLAADGAPLPRTSPPHKRRESKSSTASASSSGNSRDQSRASPSSLSAGSTFGRPLTERPADEVPQVTVVESMTAPKLFPKVNSMRESDELDSFVEVGVGTRTPFLVTVPSVAN